MHHTPSTKARSTRMHSKGTHNSAGHEQQVHATRAWEAQARITQAYTASALSGQGAYQPAVSSGQRSAHLHLGSPMNSCCKAARSYQRPGVRDRLQHAASSAATRSRAAATFVSTRAHLQLQRGALRPDVGGSRPPASSLEAHRARAPAAAAAGAVRGDADSVMAATGPVERWRCEDGMGLKFLPGLLAELPESRILKENTIAIPFVNQIFFARKNLRNGIFLGQTSTFSENIGR